MTRTPKFEIGQTVYKWTGDYGGHGVVRGITALPDGKLRYLVGHKIEGGRGEFLHIYSAGNLREPDGPTGNIGLQCPGAVGVPTMPKLSDEQTAELKQALEKSGPGPIIHLSPVEPDTELLDALCEAHRQVDSLLAQIILRDDTFRPSKSPLWPEIERRAELLRKYGEMP